MPRSARDSDDDGETRLSRRTRILANNSITNSPVRRSSRLKPPAKQSGQSPESPPNDTCIRVTRRRAGTMETVRSRKISDSSDVSEIAELDTSTVQRRSTRTSLSAVSSTDSPKPDSHAIRQFKRAGSEAKSPAPKRVTRWTRASSVDLDSINSQNKEETQTSTKIIRTRGRASMLPTEPPVAEEVDDDRSLTSMEGDSLYEERVNDEKSTNASPNHSTSSKSEQGSINNSVKDTSLVKLNMEKTKDQNYLADNVPDECKVSVVITDIAKRKVTDLLSQSQSENMIRDTNTTQSEISPMQHGSPAKSLCNDSKHKLDTSETEGEALGCKIVNRQESSPNNKENQDINIHDRSLEKPSKQPHNLLENNTKSDFLCKLPTVKDNITESLTSSKEYNKKDASEVDCNITLPNNADADMKKEGSVSNSAKSSIKTSVKQENLKDVSESENVPVTKKRLYCETDETFSLEDSKSELKVDKGEDEVITHSVLDEDVIEITESDADNSREITESLKDRENVVEIEQESRLPEDSSLSSKVEQLESINKLPQELQNLTSENIALENGRDVSFTNEKMDIDESTIDDEKTKSVTKIIDNSTTLDAEELENSLLSKINNDSCVLNTCDAKTNDTSIDENKIQDNGDNKSENIEANETEDNLRLQLSGEIRSAVKCDNDAPQQVNLNISSKDHGDLQANPSNKSCIDVSVKLSPVGNLVVRLEETEKDEISAVDKSHEIPEPMETSDLLENGTINTSAKSPIEALTTVSSDSAPQETSHDLESNQPQATNSSSGNSVCGEKLPSQENKANLLDTVESNESPAVQEIQISSENIEKACCTEVERDVKETEEDRCLSVGNLRKFNEHSNQSNKEMKDLEHNSKLVPSECPARDTDDSDADLNIGSLFQNIPADEWNMVEKTESRPSSIHSANTEKADNDCETECDLVLVDKSAWQAAEKIREMKSKQDLEYDSDDTVELKAFADSMHEIAGQESDNNKNESDDASRSSVYSVDKTALGDLSTTKKENASIQKMNSSDKTAVENKKINVSRKESLTEIMEKSEGITNTTEINSSKKRKSGVDDTLKNTSKRNVSAAEVMAEHHLNEDVDSPLTPKNLLTRRKSLNSSLIQANVPHITEKTIMKATSTPFKEKENLAMGSFGNITLFKKQVSTSDHDTSLKTNKSKSNIVDEDESEDEMVNVSKKNKSRNQRSSQKSMLMSSDDEEEQKDGQEKDQQEVVVDKDSSGKKRNSNAAVNDGNKKNVNVNYSKIVQVDSSESDADLESEDSDWRNESRKIPRFLFAQAGETSNEDSDEEEEKGSINSDIEREYNLDGKDNVEYSDDNEPGDDCRPSETESSDPEDDGADLQDFIVDDDDVEEEETEDEIDQEGEEDQDNEEDEDDEDEGANKDLENAEDEEVEKIENNLSKKIANEEVEEDKIENVEQHEIEEQTKAKNEENESERNGEIEKVEAEERDENKIEDIKGDNEKETVAEKIKEDNQRSVKDTVGMEIVEEVMDAKVAPSEKSGTMKFEVKEITSPCSSYKVTPITNAWTVEEDARVEVDKSSRNALATPLNLLNKKRKRTSDATPDVRYRKVKRMERSEEILIDKDESGDDDIVIKPVANKKLHRKKLTLCKDVRDEEATVDLHQRKDKKTTRVNEIKEVSVEFPQTKTTKVKKNAVEQVTVEKSLKKRHQQAEVAANKVPKVARSKDQIVEPAGNVKLKKRKAQLENIQHNATSDVKPDNKQRKNGKVQKVVSAQTSKKLALETARKAHEEPEIKAFAKAKEEALRAIKQTAETIKIQKQLQKKKCMDHLEKMKQPKELKEQKANRIQVIRADKTERALKRLPDEVIEHLTDEPRPRKKQKQSRRDSEVRPSRSMLAPNVVVDENFITLSSATGSTTQFDIVNLRKAERRVKRSAAVASFRQKMLARSSRQPISTYLTYLRKQKAVGTDKFHARPL